MCLLLSGIYFARRAELAANPVYATPDPSRDNIMSIYVARVLVGHVCTVRNIQPQRVLIRGLFGAQ